MFHVYSLDENEKKWFERECQKAQDASGYRLNLRGSGDSAFRAFLVAEKGYDPYDVLDINNIPKNRLHGLMEEFFKFVNDPKLDKIQKVKRIGGMHRKMFEKLNSLPIPDPGDINSLEDIAKVEEQIYILSKLYIDATQDIQSATSVEADLGLKTAYYNGFGGEIIYNKLLGPVMSFVQGIGSGILNTLIEPTWSSLSKAAMFDYIKDFYNEFKGKKISDLKTYKFNEFSTYAGNVPPFGNAVKAQYNEADIKKYLDGQAATYPGGNAVKTPALKAIEDARKAQNYGAYTELERTCSISAEPYASILTREQRKMKDLTLLPEDVKQKLLVAYEETFGRFYIQVRNMMLADLGKSQFDVIKNSKGKSISELMGKTYDNYEPLKKEEAYKLETMRHLINDKNGLKLQVPVYNDDNNNIKLCEAKTIKLIPDSFYVNFIGTFNAQEAQAYLENPSASADIARKIQNCSSTIYVNVKNCMIAQLPILERYGLSPWDCFFVGDKSLKQLMDEKVTDPNDKIDTVAYSFLVAASRLDKPVFMTVVSEENGILKRTAVPVVFGGRNMNPEHTRRADVKANRTAGQRHVKTLPVLKHIVRKSLAEVAKPGDEIFVDERAFRGIVSLYGAEQVMLSDYVEKNVYSEDTFNKQYEMHKSGSFSNDEFAILAYHTSMDPNSMKHDVYPIAKNLLTMVEKVKARHSFWTTDFVEQSGFPRENLGNHLWQIAINPARKITAEAISEFDKGNVEPVAKIISSAIRETINEMKFIGDSDRKVNSFTLSITMLNHLNQLIDSKGSKLRESVESKLSPGELKDYKVLLKYKQLMDANYKAEHLLDRDSKGEIKLSDTERQRCNAQKNAYTQAIGKWKQNMETQEMEIFATPEYAQLQLNTTNAGQEVSVANRPILNHTTALTGIQQLDNHEYGRIIVAGETYEATEENAEELKAKFRTHILSEEQLKAKKEELAYVQAKLDAHTFRTNQYKVEHVNIGNAYDDDFLNQKIVVNSVWDKYSPLAQPEMQQDPLRGRNIVKLPENIADEKYIEDNKYSYMIKNQFTNLQVDHIKDTPELDSKINLGNNKLGKSIYDISDQKNRDELTFKYNYFTDVQNRFEITDMILPEQRKELGKWVKEIHDSYETTVKNLPDEEKVFKPVMDFVLHSFVDNGINNAARIAYDNPIYKIAFTTLNFGPAIFKEKGTDTYRSRKVIKANLNEMGVLLPASSFYQGASQLVQAESKRLEDLKTGWDKEKEQRYFFNLTKAYEKLIKGYEEMNRFPMDIQNRSHDAMEDKMGDITNRTGRGIALYTYSMKWEMQAMKNGWHADNIRLFGNIGTIEGAIIKQYELYQDSINDYKEKIRKLPANDNRIAGHQQKINDLEEKIKQLREYERETFAPFKKKLFDKKITRPEDMLEVLNIIEQFRDDNADLDIVKTNNLFDLSMKGNKPLIDKISNEAIEDYSISRTNPKAIAEKYTATQVPVNEDISRDVATSIRNIPEIDSKNAEKFVEAFVKAQYLSQLNPADYPEYMDVKHPKYKITHKILNTQLKKYSKEFIEKAAGGKDQVKNFKISGNKLSDMLIYGHHDIYFSQLEDAVRISQDMNGYQNFIEGKFITPDKKTMTINDCLELGLKALNEAPEPITASNIVIEAYEKVNNLLKTKKKFDKLLKQKFENKEDCKLDPKKWEEFKKNFASTLVGIHGYLTKKDALREKKNGNLGKNGEARYKAMNTAYSTLLALKQCIDSFDNKGPEAVYGDKAFDLKQKFVFGVEVPAIDKYIECKKGFINETMEDALGKVDVVCSVENVMRNKLSSKADANKEAIIQSAEKTLYVTSLKHAYSKKTDSVSRSEEIYKDFNSTMAEYCNSKDASIHFNEFRNGYLNNQAFKTEFSKLVIDGAKRGKTKTEDILKFRDDALKNALNKNKTNANEVKKLTELSNALGSPAIKPEVKKAAPQKPEVKNPQAGNGHKKGVEKPKNNMNKH